MANGLPSQVPSLPQSGGGKTYSQMVNEQLGLIQRQRAANFEQRLSQEQKNREFREKQLQNIYDFDVSGLASGDAKLLKQLQTELANSLDPNSENSYSSSRELVSDIAFINNVYGEMKRWGQTGGAGRQSYQQSILNPDRGDGTVFTGNEELLDKRNATWEQGAFANAEILGEAGNRQIIGNVLDQDGNVMQEGVDFFENVWRNRPDEFWRPEIAQGALLLDGVALDYSARQGVDGTNVEKVAAEVFDSDPQILDRIRREELTIINEQRNELGYPPITMDAAESTFESLGLGETAIRDRYVERAKDGIGLRPTKAAPQTFSGSVYDTQFGIRAAGLAKPISVTSSTLSGDVSHVGLVGDQMVVVYEDADGEIQQARVSEGSDAWDSIVAQSGGLNALSEMVRREQISTPGTATTGEEAGTQGEAGVQEGGMSATESRVRAIDNQLQPEQQELAELKGLDRKNNQTLSRIRTLEESIKNLTEERNRLDPEGKIVYEASSNNEARLNEIETSISDKQARLAALEDREKTPYRTQQVLSEIRGLQREIIALTEERDSLAPIGPEIPEEYISRPEENLRSNQPSQQVLEERLTPDQKKAYNEGGGVAILTNNPGNLRPYEGYDGPVYINPKDDSPFQVFETPEEGIKALEADLKVKVKGRGAVGNKMKNGTLPSGARTPEEITIFDIISVYAPYIENSPKVYAKSIADFAKSKGFSDINENTPVNQVPLNLLMEAIIRVESGANYKLLSKAGLLPLSQQLASN